MKKTKTVYYLFGGLIQSDNPIPNFAVGFYWLFAIILFPVWIWFYLVYRLLSEIGRVLNGVKQEEVDEDEEKTYY